MLGRVQRRSSSREKALREQHSLELQPLSKGDSEEPSSPTDDPMDDTHDHPHARPHMVPMHNIVETHGCMIPWEADMESLGSLDGPRGEGMMPLELDSPTHTKGGGVGVKRRPPNMWAWENLALYSHYAAVGLVGGMSGVIRPICTYVYNGAPNLCANANSIVFLAWNFKIIFAIFTDTYKPLGMRRKPYMLTGWLLILLLLLLTAVLSSTLSVTAWIVLGMLVQFCVMLADVPADGYSVELGQLEPPEARGHILATGQLARFMACVFAGGIQSFLLNGPATNEPGCAVAWSGCWSWGLSIEKYYFLMFALTGILVIPIVFMVELPDHSPHRTFREFLGDIFDTCKNLTTTYLLVFVVGNLALALGPYNVTTNLQYQVIGIPNLLSGIDGMTTYLTLSLGIMVFKKFLINRNWRTINYVSGIFSACLGFLWILPFHNIGGTRNGYFTILIDLDQSFAAGLSQVLFSMTVIELAKPGQEATVYELLISVANSCSTVATILSTQLLSPLKATTCIPSHEHSCPPDAIDPQHFDETGGPQKSTRYLVVTTLISIAACLAFTQFLPTQKAMCQTWKEMGANTTTTNLRAWLTLTVAVVIVTYGIVGSLLLLNPKTACMRAIGGSGCGT